MSPRLGRLLMTCFDPTAPPPRLPHSSQAGR
jgi:hypothetical protein